MIRGGLGFVDKKKMLLPTSLLQPLNIGIGSVIYGLYYPQPNKTIANGNSPGKPDPDSPILHDFFLTTIAHRYWRRSATFIINIRHEPGSFAPVLDFIRDQNVSILRAECSRAAHRYATWNVTLCFENLMEEEEPEPNTSPYENDLFKSLQNEVKKLERKLNRRLQESLFSNGEDPSLKNPVVIGKAITTLPYFADIANKASSLGTKEFPQGVKRQPFRWFDHPRKMDVVKKLFEPFELKAGPTFIKCSRLQNILEIADQLVVNNGESQLKSQNRYMPQKKNLFPACVFAEVDTTQLTLRLAFLGNNQLDRFFEIEIAYERSAMGENSKGLFAEIVNRFPRGINIWRTYNQTTFDGTDSEAGLIRVIIEHLEDFESPSNRFNFVKEAFDNLVGKCKASDLEHVKITDVYVNQIDPDHVKNTLLESNEIATGFAYDVFISYHSEDVDFATEVWEKLTEEGFSVYFSKSSLRSGDAFLPAIKEGLLRSREVCLIWSRDSNSNDYSERAREWVTTEWGIAWALDKPIVPFLINGRSPADLPKRLQSIQSIVFNFGPKNFFLSLNQYVANVKSRIRAARRRTYYEEH